MGILSRIQQSRIRYTRLNDCQDDLKRDSKRKQKKQRRHGISLQTEDKKVSEKNSTRTEESLTLDPGDEDVNKEKYNEQRSRIHCRRNAVYEGEISNDLKELQCIIFMRIMEDCGLL